MASLPAPDTAPPVPSTASERQPFVRPFFEDKAAAFWKLQAAGWSGYLVLRSVSSLSVNFSLKTIVPVIIESIIGYCITLLLSTLYGYYRELPRVTGLILTLFTLAAATFLYATLNAFSFSFTNQPAPGVDLKTVLDKLDAPAPDAAPAVAGAPP